MCFFKLADIYVITDLCKHFTFLYLYSYLFEKIKKVYFFCTLYFIFKTLTYKKNSKPIGENSSLVTFFLTTRYLKKHWIYDVLGFWNSRIRKVKDGQTIQNIPKIISCENLWLNHLICRLEIKEKLWIHFRDIHFHKIYL